MLLTVDEDENGAEDAEDAEGAEDDESGESGDAVESEENELIQNGQSFEENAVVAIRSSTNANELFYLCQIIDIKQAQDNREDEYGHKVVKGDDYLECVYLELKDPMAKKGYYLYKRLKKVKIVFVLPEAEQVFCPSVNVTENLKLDVQEHQFLADCLTR